MLDWFYHNETLAYWLLLISVFSFFATLMVVPIILVMMPADYFSPHARHRISTRRRHIALLLPLWIIKNTVGLMLVIAGLLMLALPGQGILTMVVGLVFLDFPGKYQVERKVISNERVLRTINWIRAKSRKPPLLVPQDED